MSDDGPSQEDLSRFLTSALGNNVNLQRSIETLFRTVEELRAIVTELREAAAAAREDRCMAEDEPVEGVQHVIGYGPPRTIGMCFDTNCEATAVTGSCSQECIKRCWGELTAAERLAEVAKEIRPGVTVWSCGFHQETIFAVANGRLSSCLVYNDGDKRLLVDGMSGEDSRQFRGREIDVAWLREQPMNPYWRRRRMTWEETLFAPEEDGAILPHRVEFVEHPQLTCRLGAVAHGRMDWNVDSVGGLDPESDGDVPA